MRRWGNWPLLAALSSLAACSGGEHRIHAAEGRGAANATQAGDMPGSVRSSKAHPRFAALPDRGELMRYDGQAPVRDGAYTWHRASLSEQHAVDAVAGGVLRVMTPDGRALSFQYDRSIRHDESGDWTWVGHLPAQPDVQAVLTFGAGAVYGSIGQAHAAPLRITTRGGASWLVESDQSGVASLASDAANPASPDRIVSAAAIERSLAAARPAASTAAAATTIDLLIGYTRGFAASQGSGANVTTRLNSMVDAANVALANRHVAGRLRLVHAMAVNYTDTSRNDEALRQLTGFVDGSGKAIPPAAAFNPLRAAREQYGADLVSLVRPYRNPEQAGCGVQAATEGLDDLGYSVISDGADRNERNGQTYFCRDDALAQQVDRSSGSNVAHGEQGIPAIAGFRATVVADPMRRVRSDFDGDGKTDLLWRNAAKGANAIWKSADSSMTQPIASVAKTWRVAGVGDFDGDGVADILWRNTSTGGNSIWRSGNSATTQGVTSMPDPAWQVGGIGDFDADGRADVLWRNSVTGANVIWKSANSATPQATSTVATAWQVAGVGDFTGDGKADILWRNASSGANSIWKSGNLSTPQPVGSLAGTAWQVAGVGDFDGDGKADILWRNKASGTNAIWPSANSATQHTMMNVASTWKVAGIGDFDGDGQSDILWRASDTGDNTIWLSANSHTPQAVTAMPDQAWQVGGLAP